MKYMFGMSAQMPPGKTILLSVKKQALFEQCKHGMLPVIVR